MVHTEERRPGVTALQWPPTVRGRAGVSMFVGYELTAVPEPSTWVAMAALVLTGAFFKRKRQNPSLR